MSLILKSDPLLIKSLPRTAHRSVSEDRSRESSVAAQSSRMTPQRRREQETSLDCPPRSNPWPGRLPSAHVCPLQSHLAPEIPRSSHSGERGAGIVPYFKIIQRQALFYPGKKGGRGQRVGRGVNGVRGMRKRSPRERTEPRTPLG
ncbi:hypothetical protein DPEC_G00273180 [Dallia pectoralis]|uniref:Uncharacterized protein n=1 Tax=Dallia pectoralis TaxID=75939 RepID=A0ACC2FQE7_DALPE|nr:hypothetical protein DPEC_G00273180 [Dallia pectoralis]